jgi:hypothetical protein
MPALTLGPPRAILWERRPAMESMPFLHANQIFTLTFFEDLAFADVRAIIDELIGKNAFAPEVQENEGMYVIERETACFSVWVTGLEIIIRRG